MAEGRQRHAERLPVRDPELGLPVPQALHQLVREEGGADRVEEAVVGRPRIHELTDGQLLDVPHALELHGVHHDLDDRREVHQSMHGVIRREGRVSGGDSFKGAGTG